VTPSAGAVLALARWGLIGGHNSSWRAGGPQYAAELRIFLYFAAELRILLVYLSVVFGWLVDVVRACAIAELVIGVDI